MTDILMIHILLLARHSTDEEIYQSNSGSDQDTSNITGLTIKTTNISYTSTSSTASSPSVSGGSSTSSSSYSLPQTDDVSTSIAFFKKRDYDINKPVVSFEGEAVVDGGGPGREYFNLLLKSILSPCPQIKLFEGSSFIVQALHNTDALRASMFKVAGRMIAASIVNDGPSFPYLSPAVYKYLTSKSTENVLPDITRSDVVNYEVLQAIDEVCVKLVP